MAKACNLAHLLRPHGAAPYSRGYMAVGVQVARQVLKGRKPFSSYDLKFKRLPNMSKQNAVHHAGEFLASWVHPDRRGNSNGANAILDACPELADKTRKRWRGW